MTLKIEFYDVGEHEHRPYAASAQLLASQGNNAFMSAHRIIYLLKS